MTAHRCPRRCHRCPELLGPDGKVSGDIMPGCWGGAIHNDLGACHCEERLDRDRTAQLLLKLREQAARLGFKLVKL